MRDRSIYKVLLNLGRTPVFRWLETQSILYTLVLWPWAWTRQHWAMPFSLFGMVAVCHIFMFVENFIWILGLSKIILYFSPYKSEYKNSVIVGLYDIFLCC